MATIGHIEEFREDKEEWSQYAERLGHLLLILLLSILSKTELIFLCRQWNNEQ